MDRNDGKVGGISLLSLDGGGPGSISQLRILQEYVTRLAHDRGVDVDSVLIADLFDAIGGVGFGSFVALLLGPLRMPVSQAIEELVTIGTALFPDGQKTSSSLEENSKRLKVAVEGMLRRHDYPINIKLKDSSLPASQCKTVVFATPTVDATRCQLFRTYSSRQGFLDCTFVEAACATLSMTSHFSPVSIGPRLLEQTFTSASIGFNNPTRELIKEAMVQFGSNARVSTILSIGSGLPALISLDGPEPAHHESLKRIVVDCEKVARELTTQLFNVDAYLRLNVDRGMENMELSDWKGLGKVVGHTSAYLEAPAVTKAIDSSIQRLQDRVGSITLGQLNTSSRIRTQAKSVPAVSPYFVVRKEYLDAMEQHLVVSPEAKRKILVLSGMGGCGKTQMVAYFVQEYHSQYKHTFFVDASSHSSIQSDLQAAIRSLGEGYDQRTFEEAISFLIEGAHDGKWLLIFDNADDPKLRLLPYLPACFFGTILITTRNCELGSLANTAHLELRPMRNEEAYKTLTKAAQRTLPLSRDEDVAATHLIADLGNLAVALTQAGRYCYRMSSSGGNGGGNYTFSQYLGLFNKHRAELMSKGEVTALDDYGRGAYTTFNLSYSLLPESARELLHVSGYFHHADISLAMLECAVRNNFSDMLKYLSRPESHSVVKERLRALLCPDGRWNELHIHGIIQTLQAFSLISTTSISATVYLRFHPLVHAWSRDILSSSEAINYRRMATQVVVSCTSTNDILLYRFLLPHVMSLESEPIADVHVNDRMGFGRVFSELGNYSKAETLFQGVLNELKDNMGEGDRNTIAASTWLSHLYWKQGKWPEAEKVVAKALEQQRRLFGTNSRAAIDTAGNLALTYWQQGKWREAEEMQVEVLEQRQRLFGKDDPKTMLTAANLATTYQRQGKLKEAEKIEVEVLEQLQRLFGKDNPETMRGASNLAVTYGSQGRLDDSEKLEVELLEQRLKHLGADHPETIRSTAHLGWTYYNQKRLNEAEKLVAEAVEMSEKLIGKEHPDTMRYSEYLSAIRDASTGNQSSTRY